MEKFVVLRSHGPSLCLRKQVASAGTGLRAFKLTSLSAWLTLNFRYLIIPLP